MNNGHILATNLVQKSALYIGQHYNAQPAVGDIYKCHGLLPLAIFHPYIEENAVQCRGCERELPPSSFTTGGRKRRLAYLCLVCQAVERREEYMVRWNRNNETQDHIPASPITACILRFLCLSCRE